MFATNDLIGGFVVVVIKDDHIKWNVQHTRHVAHACTERAVFINIEFHGDFLIQLRLRQYIARIKIDNWRETELIVRLY
ncbi:hypothetical protein P781_14210 [Vibrio mimicus CAIM 1883]|nr:hypothetical protein P781_14210 [Vibrio mimicus CAIM 1883]